MHSACRPFRLQPPAEASSRQGTLPVGGSDREGIPPRVTSPRRTRGFATALQARHLTPAESSSSAYGLVVHLLLLSTPCCHDAVAVGYKLRLLGEDFHLSGQVRSQAHSAAARRRLCRSLSLPRRRQAAALQGAFGATIFRAARNLALILPITRRHRSEIPLPRLRDRNESEIMTRLGRFSGEATVCHCRLSPGRA
jgi:hypothetical protein